MCRLRAKNGAKEPFGNDKPADSWARDSNYKNCWGPCRRQAWDSNSQNCHPPLRCTQPARVRGDASLCFGFCESIPHPWGRTTGGVEILQICKQILSFISEGKEGTLWAMVSSYHEGDILVRVRCPPHTLQKLDKLFTFGYFCIFNKHVSCNFVLEQVNCCNYVCDTAH